MQLYFLCFSVSIENCKTQIFAALGSTIAAIPEDAGEQRFRLIEA
jgi:hypothetical protein